MLLQKPPRCMHPPVIPSIQAPSLFFDHFGSNVKQLVRLVQRVSLSIVSRRVEFSSTQWRRKGRSLWIPKWARMIATVRKTLFVTRLTTPG